MTFWRRIFYLFIQLLSSYTCQSYPAQPEFHSTGILGYFTWYFVEVGIGVKSANITFFILSLAVNNKYKSFLQIKWKEIEIPIGWIKKINPVSNQFFETTMCEVKKNSDFFFF